MHGAEKVWCHVHDGGENSTSTFEVYADKSFPIVGADFATLISTGYIHDYGSICRINKGKPFISIVLA